MKFKIIYNREKILYVIKIDSDNIDLNKEQFIFDGTVYEAIDFFKNININTKILEKLKVQ